VTTTQTQKRQAAAPTGLAAAPVGTGGTFTAGAKFWKITAVTRDLGESAPSAEATATVVLNGSGSLTWTGVPANTTAVLVYRGTATGAENTLVATLGPGVTSFTDTGAAGGATSPPAVSAWSAAAKTPAGAPTKANVPAGTPAGPGNSMYAGLVGWTGQPNGGSGQARNRKYVLAAGYDVQEV
jgi:hypothetical protein